jgi:hypothetical protein
MLAYQIIEIVPGVHTNLSVGTVRIVANVIMHAATLKMSVEAGLRSSPVEDRLLSSMHVGIT